MAVDLATLSTSTEPAQDTRKLRQVFASTTPESCPNHYNFHMHTVASDGRLQPEQLAEQAVANGLSGFAITDHHSTKGFRRAQRWLKDNTTPAARPHLWSGVEINAKLLNCEVHILCYGFDPEHSEAKAAHKKVKSITKLRQKAQDAMAKHKMYRCFMR